MDERRVAIGTRAMGMTLAATYAFIMLAAIWKYVRTGDIMNSAWEIGLLVFIPFSVLWFARKDEALLLPKTFLSEELPTESDASSKERRKRQYAMNALAFSIAFTLLTIVAAFLIEKNGEPFILFKSLSASWNYVISFSLMLVSDFAVFFLLNYVGGEYVIKKYNRHLDELEDFHE